MFQKLGNKWVGFTNLILLFFVFVTFILSLYCYSNTCNLLMSKGEKIGCIIVGVILLTSIFAVIWKKINNLTDRYCKIIAYIILFLIVVLQVVILVFFYRAYPVTDSYKVMDEAMALLKSENGIINNISGYYSRYSNNYFVTIALYYYFQILSFFGIDHLWDWAIGLNIVLFDLGIYLTYKTAAYMWGNKKGLMTAIMMFLCPTTYVWLCFVYTNTFSIPFLMGILYITLRIKGYDSRRKKVTYGILYGFISMVGIMLRPTVLIGVIASIIYLLLRGQHRKKILFYAVSIAVLGITYVSVKSVETSHLSDTTYEKSFPPTHWIMMALNGEGGYNGADVQYTKQFKTKEEKIEANLEEIQNRVCDQGVVGLTLLAKQKIIRVWADGVDESDALNRKDIRFVPSFLYIYGDKNGIFTLYRQIFRATTFFLILVSLWSQKRRQWDKSEYLYLLTLLGAILFFLLWEANKKYNISFMYVLILLMSSGVFHLKGDQSEKRISVFHQKWGLKHLYRLCAIVTVVFFCIGYKRYVVEQHTVCEFSRREEDNIVCRYLKNGNGFKVVQTFKAQNHFNTIELRAKKDGKGKSLSCYTTSLFDSEHRLLRSGQFTSNDLEKGKIKIAFNTVTKSKNDSYILEIERVYKGENWLNFGYNISKVFDTNQSGSLIVGKNKKHVDLYMQIYDKRVESRMGGGVYILIGILILSIELGLQRMTNSSTIVREIEVRE